MMTNLFAKSNAILSEINSDGDGNNTIAIIVCKKKEILDSRLKRAIKDHHVVDGEIELSENAKTLDNQAPQTFTAIWESDGEPETREFEIQIVATYKD